MPENFDTLDFWVELKVNDDGVVFSFEGFGDFRGVVRNLSRL